METLNKMQRKGSVRWLTELIEEGFKIMRTYNDGDNLEIYLNRKLGSLHVQGNSPEYRLVQETYNTIWVNLDNLRALKSPIENIEGLSGEFIELGRKCEQKHLEEQNGRK